MALVDALFAEVAEGEAALDAARNGLDTSAALLKDVGAVQLGRQRAPQHHTGENMRPYLRVANVFEDRIDFTDVKAMNFTPDEFRTYELKPGDILLNEGPTPDLLGRSAMWRGEFEGYTSLQND